MSFTKSTNGNSYKSQSISSTSNEIVPSWKKLSTKITDSAIYPYLLRLAILTYRTQPRFLNQSNNNSTIGFDNLSLHPSRSPDGGNLLQLPQRGGIHSRNHSRSVSDSASALTNGGHRLTSSSDYSSSTALTSSSTPPPQPVGLGGIISPVSSSSSPASSPSFSTKLPKDVPKLLQSKFKDMALKPDASIRDDPLLRRSYLAYYAVLLSPDILRQIKETRRAEDLVMQFVSCSAKELNKSGIDPIKLKGLLDQHCAAFVQLLIETIRESGRSHHGSSYHQALIKQLESYESSLKSSSREILQPSISNGNFDTNGGTNSAASASSSIAPTFELSDMTLAKDICSLLLISSSEMQRDILENKSKATENLAIAELKCLELHLRAYDRHPVYQPTDFRNDSEYLEWKQSEIQAISKQISIYQNRLPDLSIPNSTDSLFYIPDDPKSFYRHVLKRCLERDFKTAGYELLENPDRSTVLMSKSSIELLNKISALWRIPAISRAVILLDVSEELFKEDVFSLDNLNDAFNLAKYIANDKKLLQTSNIVTEWSPNLWPYCDRVYFITVLSGFQKTILNEIANALRHIYDDTPPKIGPFLQALDEHIFNNTNLDQQGNQQVRQGELLFASLEPSPKQIKKLENVIISTAEQKYDALIDDIPRDHTLDPLHIIDLADKLIAIAKRLQKRYKFALFEKISIGHISAERHLTLFSADSQSMFNHMMAHLRARDEEPSFDDMIILYKKVAEIRDLFVQVSDLDFGFDIEANFYPFVAKWAESSAQLAQSWVDPAIEGDNFLPVDEEAGVLNSSSVVDIFTSFHSAIDMIYDLKWRNDVHVAKFLTMLMKGISSATCQYSSKLLNLFLEELKGTEEQHPQIRTRQDKWIALAKTAVNGKEKIIPYHFLKETCVKLNNIEVAQVELDKIESEIDSEKLSEIIAKAERNQQLQKKPNAFLFSVKIMHAEGLKACDMNGLSDPYVTLVDQTTRKQIGKTRTIYEDLNPIWNEMFEIATTGPKWLTATVWDENSISNHDLCGRAFIRLDPSAFEDFLSQVS